MTAMSPSPEQRIEVTEGEEVLLDDVIQQIDKTLPIVHRKCEANAGRPSGRINRRSIKIFRAMRDNPLLNNEGNDICLCAEEKLRERLSAPHECDGHTTPSVE